MSIFDAPYEKQDFYFVRSYIIPLINMARYAVIIECEDYTLYRFINF